MHKELINKIVSKKATVGVIGLGYVGLPLLLRFAQEGFKVIGFDVDEGKVERLRGLKSYIKHIGDEVVKTAFSSGNATATSEFSKVQGCDAVIICVPTPLGKHQEPDMKYIVETMNSILPFVREGQLVSLESTTYPGTTDELLKPSLEGKGFKVGEDIFLVFSPEREDPGNKDFSTSSIPKVVGGVTPQCLEAGVALYSKVIKKVVPVSSARAAEMTKLLENIYRSVNIGLINEMKMVADRMGIDIWEVIDAASTKPFGFTPFYPGPGLGGHCIPIDPFYLTWKAKEYGIHTRFIETAGEINNSMPEYVVGKVTEGLNMAGKSLKGSKVLIMGLSYKKNIDDMRESPSVEILSLLSSKGAVLSYCDPYVPDFPKMRRHKYDLKSVNADQKTVAAADCVIIATDHDIFDYEFIQKNASLVVDTRGRYRKPYQNVIKA